MKLPKCKLFFASVFFCSILCLNNLHAGTCSFNSHCCIILYCMNIPLFILILMSIQAVSGMELLRILVPLRASLSMIFHGSSSRVYTQEWNCNDVCSGTPELYRYMFRNPRSITKPFLNQLFSFTSLQKYMRAVSSGSSSILSNSHPYHFGYSVQAINEHCFQFLVNLWLILIKGLIFRKLKLRGIGNS